MPGLGDSFLILKRLLEWQGLMSLSRMEVLADASFASPSVLLGLIGASMPACSTVPLKLVDVLSPNKTSAFITWLWYQGFATLSPKGLQQSETQF